MGAIGGLTGLAGGASGTGFAGPQAYSNGVQPIVNPTDYNQIQKGYGQNQDALAQQQSLLNALQRQGGIQNQSDVYGQFQDIAAGRGPNPAQAMLNQATGQNVANQAALMAGQRGAGANVGLLARQAALQGGNLQQQAVGQGATMQAQQSMNALNSAGGIANNQVANQIGATNANTLANQAFQNQLLGAQGAANNANVALQSNLNNTNAHLAGIVIPGQQAFANKALDATGIMGKTASGGGGGGAGVGDAIGGASGGGLDSSAMMMAAGATGGPVDSMPVISSQPMAQVPVGPQSAIGRYLMGQKPQMAQGGMTQDYKSGGGVQAKSPNEKAQVSGNSYANDKIPAMLSEGEVVIPRDVMQAKDPVKAAASFVQSVLAKRKVR